MENQIQAVAIIGAGTMGPDVAAIFARHGIDVRLNDLKPEALERAKGAVDTVYEILIDGGLMTRPEADSSLAHLTFTLDQDEALHDVDFVLEAIPEKLELKRALFGQLEAKVRENTILASNSSGIPVTKLAQAIRRPERVIGTHWLNQPYIIPVVEVIKGAQTDEATVEATKQLLKWLGIIPILIKGDVPGFVHNRLLFAIYREVLHLLEEGVVGAEDIDNVTKWAIGPKLTAIGPVEMLDVAGLDVYNNVANYLNPDLSVTGGVSEVIRDKVERGELGIKTGRGMFQYEPGEIRRLMQGRRQMMLNVIRLKLAGKEVTSETVS
jgi:3-hydroxyacyl-CoA dehydrogenase